MSWRQRSQARGMKVLSFSIPLFLIAMIGSSQIPRGLPDLLVDRTLKTHRIKASFTIRSSGESPVQMYLEMQPSLRQPMAFIYKIRQGKDLLRSRKLTLRPTNKEGLQGIDQAFLLAPGRYTVFASFSKKQWAKEGRKPWRFGLLRNPIKAHVQIFRYLEMLTFPALSLIILGLVMVMVPRLINDG
ncbi:hypothetical protein SAMN06296036_11557 [Pseudobacteriovorax antillogorgiicola]|uniref:Uncharacterized protein n=2 Tax=Pseudobacteriovorax antillogorgiicola TaxID=1513793 RepID=A0A1Y6C7P6_9BACT|nr:hypothetical protein EDD56_11088 [Pseudobacteriovorax antillogorgiicola]SMF49241.1 hypothetical protein SAMN06296036_11557 [Pseudobacteriovorax antillogorgiicola]